MLKVGTIVLLSLVLSACSDSYNTMDFPVVPEELKDCKFFSVSNSSGSHLKVVRCPNSQTSTTYIEGKVTKTTVVIDGATYEKVN